ncbi:MAG: transcriptional regulator [Candidatus Parcubacteria bacterium]|nr:MAG: transcriptional regulator [Candidatus Parcubacteria bacterium]
MATQNTVKREALAQKIADKFDLPKKTAVEILNYFVELVSSNLKGGNKVKLPGLGTFKVRERKARTAINPKTGEKITVPASRVPKFTPAKELKALFK